MPIAVCTVPVSAMRSEPSHKSEMVSQLIFGECCETLEEGNIPWIRIRCLFDGYEGWCLQSHITQINTEQFQTGQSMLTPDWVTDLEFNGVKMMVPMGSSLNSRQEKGFAVGLNKIEYHGKVWDPGKANNNSDNIRELATRFLNTAYLWGGKSIFGIDCSGYTQTIFKFFGIHLARDAQQQALQGQIVELLEESSCGNLAFFDNDQGCIVHVGILLNAQQIIHSSGKVRIDNIDKSGIIHSESLERTHQLRFIKKYF